MVSILRWFRRWKYKVRTSSLKRFYRWRGNLKSDAIIAPYKSDVSRRDSLLPFGGFSPCFYLCRNFLKKNYFALDIQKWLLRKGWEGGACFLFCLKSCLTSFWLSNVLLESLSVLWALYRKMFLRLCPSCWSWPLYDLENYSLVIFLVHNSYDCESL